MTGSRRRITLASASIAALLATAACSGGRSTSTPDDALLRDLEQASGTGVATASARTQVVSAIELGASPKAAPERRVVRRTATPKAPAYAAAPAPAKEEPAPAVVPTKEPEPAPSVQTLPEPTPAPATESPRAEAPMRVPLPAPSPRNGRHGGYKSVGDVIRNAPFPINP